MEGEITTKLHRKQSEKLFHGELKKNQYRSKKPVRKFKWGSCLKNGVDLSGKFIKVVSDLPPCCTNPNEEQSEIQEFFRNSEVLITGATGFMGKILVEKLLVSCPNIGRVYLIIREKKGKSVEERFSSLFEDNVFTRLRKLVPDFRIKVFCIKGDCSLPRLGLSEDDYEMLSNRVSVIFHSAATVRFDEVLTVATNINVRGTLEMMKFARSCKSLKSLVHVSTSYANCTLNNKDITEEFHQPAYDYKRLSELIERESEETLRNMTQSIIAPWPNTYSFTKQIGEDVVKKEGQGLPVGVFRPAIVIASYKEPLRGWSDNLYGPSGIIVGAGTGIVRVVQADSSNAANLVPVDMAVNGLIAAAYKISLNHRNGRKSMEIFNYVSAARNPISWAEFTYWNRKYGEDWPTPLAIWYFFLIQVKNRFMYSALNFCLHTLPSCLADGILLLCGKKPKMMKVYQKINRFNDVLSYFSTNSWNFSDHNVASLWKSLSPKDQEIFPFDIGELDWDFHAQAHVLGLRIHIVKDDIDTLTKGREKWRRLRILHRSVQTLLLVTFAFLFMKFFRVTLVQP